MNRQPCNESARRVIVVLLAAILVITMVAQNAPLQVAVQLGLPVASGFSPYAAAASGATTARVSVNSSGAAGTADSQSSIQNMSGDGRYVVFRTSSANFPGANTWQQVYRRDRTAGTTMLGP